MIADNPSGMKCDPCRRIGYSHCSDPEHCGGMKPMTDPTPTRAEVERYSPLWSFGEMLECTDGEYVRFTDYQALRERAEAAERHKDAGWDQQRYWCDRYVNKTAALEKALVEARRAEAAAWNDAIEAAGNLESIHGYSNAVPRHRIRALRRAAPTEGEA